MARSVLSHSRLSTISLALPVQSSATGATTPATANGDATTDQKSFADFLKETHDDSDKDNQTATTPRPLTSPKKAASHVQEPHQKTANAAPASAMADVNGTPQILDTRSLLLSLQKSAPSTKARVPTATVTSAATAASSAPKAPLAFGVSISKQPAASTKTSAAEPATPSGTTATSAKRDGQRGESGANDSGSQDSPNAAAAAAALKDATQTAAATAVAAPAGTTGTTAVVPVAYTPAPMSIATAVPVTAPAPVTTVVDPPVTPAVRPQSIDLKVPGTGGDGVDVRVSQVAGDVQVTVRTPDSDLAQSLRQHLPELSDRLSQSGVSGEVWQPAAAAAETSLGNGATQDEPGSNWQGSQQDSQQQQAQTDPDAEQNQSGNRWLDQFYNAEQETP